MVLIPDSRQGTDCRCPKQTSGHRSPRLRILFLALLTVSLAGCRPFYETFYDDVVTPDVIGLVQSADRVTFQGTEYELDPFADYSEGRAAEGDLLLFGTKPDVWYVAARPHAGGCYAILVGAAYDDDDSLIVNFSGFDFGVRLKKGEGFIADRRPIATQAGRPAYHYGSQGVGFCLDRDGKVTG